MKLIDADEFQKQIVGMAILNNYPPNKANALCELIDSQPTAFDVEKVIEQLNDLLEEKTTDSGDDWYTAECLSKAIEIVKRGGRDEDYWK